jgi:hypothetical protein
LEIRRSSLISEVEPIALADGFTPHPPVAESRPDATGFVRLLPAEPDLVDEDGPVDEIQGGVDLAGPDQPLQAAGDLLRVGPAGRL